MNCKLLSRMFALMSLTLLCSANTVNAGIITNTTNNSFIDETTQLEWMDFGINNAQSYNYVASQLGEGQEYAGWNLATKEQVYSLWGNIFLGKGGNENLNAKGPGQFYVSDGANQVGSVWLSLANTLGFNELKSVGLANENTYSLGWFSGTNGLSYVEFVSHTDAFGITNYNDFARIIDNTNYDGLRNSQIAGYSTMLVRSVEVPEPPALAAFLFGLIGLMIRKVRS